MFGLGGGFNGPGGNSSNSGSAPSGKSTSKNGNSPSEGPSHFGGSGLGQPNKSAGGSMGEARSIDRAGVTGYAGNSKTHEQDIAERHAARADHVRRAGEGGLTPAGRVGRMSTNVEGMTAQDFADQRARQVGGMIAQTNTALRSNDLMSPFSMESTYDTRYRPQEQTPVSTAMSDGTALSLQAGRPRTFDPVPLGRYRTADTFSYGPANPGDLHEFEMKMEPIGTPRGMLPDGLSYNPSTGLIERVR